MPDPIQSASNSSSYESAEAERAAAEERGQVCLPPAQPNASVARAELAAGPASTPPDAPRPPGTSLLVARFSPPTGAHPPVEPSLLKAVKYCSLEAASAALDLGHGIVAHDLVAGAHALINVGAAARCIVRNEAEQVKQGEVTNQSADCVRDGAIPLLEADGTVICASQ